MPEKPKRRKNKNKRKTKSNQNNINHDKNSSEIESCSSHGGGLTTECVASSEVLHDTPSQCNNNEEKIECLKSCDEIDHEQKVSALNENDTQNVKEPSENNEETTKYIVETPEHKKNKPTKINCKSKSLDNDDDPKIVEVTEDNLLESNLPVIDNSNVIITDVETDVNWENTSELSHGKEPVTGLVTGTVSTATISLDIAQCNQTNTITADQETSLRNFLKTLNLSTSPENIDSVEIKTEIEQIINREVKHRLRKKGLTEDNFSQRLCPRMLDVIDEEGSGDSSSTSRRHSYLNDKSNENDDLEDDVFESKNESTQKYNAKSVKTIHNKSLGRLIPQQCVLVDAKLKEPEISEARGDWSVKVVEKMTGAELVYLTDSSSSTSSLHEIGDETDDSVESDISVRIITPTIEVTDTENLLKKTFVSPNNHEITPIPKSTNKLETGNKDNKDEYIIKIDTEDTLDKTLTPNSHEILVLSTENLKTNLYVKELDDCLNDIKPLNATNKNNTSLSSDKSKNEFDLEIKVIKCELNDAFNNLIKEVTSDSELENDTSKEAITRQDSSSSIGSSQCTAKYNPTSSSLNDISALQHDDIIDETSNNGTTPIVITHVKDVINTVTGTLLPKLDITNVVQPESLKEVCVKKIASLPYGEKILEELASVSERLQNISMTKLLSTDKERNVKSNHANKQNKDNIPPPVKPRVSSLKRKSSQEDDHAVIESCVRLENKYLSMSPSQKMLMEKTNTVIEDETARNNIEKKTVRHDFSNENVKDNLFENKIRSTSTPSFKSQTGSRLLALICDPTITSNVNSLKSRLDNNSNETKQQYLRTENVYTKNDINSKILSLNSFKPIPPPRPKKLSSSYYESDESSSNYIDNSLRSIKSEKKTFHYSTGNLNKEIESDISSIQNMHRYCTNIRDQNLDFKPRRPSLPKDLCDQQMEYIRQKEKEVEAELYRLENKDRTSSNRKGPRAPLISEKELVEENFKDLHNYTISRKKDVTISSPYDDEREDRRRKLSSLFSSSQEELHREKMYTEYVSQMAERQERKQHKVIKMTNTPASSKVTSKSMPMLEILDSGMNNRIEEEFISKARERWEKLGIRDPETDDERESRRNLYREPKIIEHKIKVIEGGEEKDVQKLPSHLQEFVKFTAKDKDEGTYNSEPVMITPTFRARSSSPAVWRPGAPTPPPAPGATRSPGAPPPPPPPPVWTPGSAGTSPQSSRKTFRPVHFEETPPSRRKFGTTDQNGCTSGSESEGRLRTSQSAPATGLSALGGSTSRLPKAQNPTVTLLQKAREGQLPKGPVSLPTEQRNDSIRLPRDRPSPPKGDPVHALRREYASEGERGGARGMSDARGTDGVGPTTRDGMPVALRSEAKDPSRWYKKMYDTIHKNKYDDDYVTIRYKSRKGQPPERVTPNKSHYAYFDPRSGYLSEPEGGLGRLGSSTWSDAYDSDVTTGPRRRTASVQEDRRISDGSSTYLPSNKYSTLASARASQEVYKNQPGRIENYVPGKSSVVDQEAKQWWDEVMDIFDGQNLSSTTSLPQPSPKEKKDITSAILSKSNMAKALKESGYESDSTLIFRRRDDVDAPLSPAERRAAYRDLQAGGEPPLRGFRSPAPPRQENDTAPEPPRRTQHGSYSDTESPRRYVESDVNIHYRCPVRHDPLPLVPERELARQQAEHMKRLYREQKRNKYLQELQDMQNRRHQDNFTPSQKTVVPLNRYDDADRVVAKALYTFNGQTSRELSFRKGDIIQVRRQIDANWFEGEVNGKIGLFPYNYVEIQKGHPNQAPKKQSIVEGKARAKFDFTAQTNLELPLKKGEIVTLTRRIDQNWWEGRNGVKTGIFPDSYVTILQEPSQNQSSLSSDKPAASPAAHGLINGSDRRSMGPRAHRYTPQQNSPALCNAPPATQPLPGYVAKPAHATLTPSERGYGPPTGAGVDLNNSEPLYVDTNAEAIPYRAMYRYRPQNPDELELNEGDTVYVLEKCDDGWYVGSSQRTGRFGTFPGNYVERI